VTGGTRLAPVLLAVVLASPLAGCGGSAESSSPARADLTKAADLSTCAADATAVDPPYGDGFPEDWPFPGSTVVYNAEDRGADGTIVTAVSTAPFARVLDVMNGEVVDAGFAIEKGETEAHDAEAEWEGNGFRGRWAIRESAQCPGETVVQVLSTAD
jgi:hypothetical protein